MTDLSLFPDALIAAFLGYGVVFTGLIMLLVVVVIMGKIMVAKKAAPATQSAAPAPAAVKEGPEAPGSAGKIALHNVSDKDAALIMAIVADKLGQPINQLRFKSIKEVK